MEKVYLILGASSDLGIELIKNIIKSEGAEKIRMIAHYFSSGAEIQNIKDNNPDFRIDMLNANLGDLEDTRKFIEQLKALECRPDYILNFCAYAYRFNRLSELDIKRMNFDMTIQVYSFALICQAFLPVMAESGFGKIVVMLSAATTNIPPKNTTEYTTVKYALLGLIKSIAADYGEYGININAVSPGMIETKFIKNIGRKVKEFTAEKNPRHRNLQVSDVVPAIMFLLSDESQFMNGTNINLSGIPD
ncbi:MAG: SDR family oxidoreductase [Lachnospiraceae bacterium]|nr:SDR family oxidoreductase [Lachnospiraceae bacterium]